MVTSDASAKITARKKRQAVRTNFQRAHRAEKKFARQLSSVARQVGAIVKGMAPKGVPRNPHQLTDALNRYADIIKPWATEVSASLIEDISRRDLFAWASLSRDIGRNLKKEIAGAPTGEAFRLLMKEQVNLIQSLPREAAGRIHKLVIEGMTLSRRPESIAKEIMKTQGVTQSRAMLIARTETTRSSTAMVQSRATYVGSEGYIWQTAEDSDVRDRHQHLQGKFIPWNQAPVAGENGERYHAGSGPNCRCWAEPVIPDIIT